MPTPLFPEITLRDCGTVPPMSTFSTPTLIPALKFGGAGPFGTRVAGGVDPDEVADHLGAGGGGEHRAVVVVHVETDAVARVAGDHIARAGACADGRAGGAADGRPAVDVHAGDGRSARRQCRRRRRRCNCPARRVATARWTTAPSVDGGEQLIAVLSVARDDVPLERRGPPIVTLGTETVTPVPVRPSLPGRPWSCRSGC